MPDEPRPTTPRPTTPEDAAPADPSALIARCATLIDADDIAAARPLLRAGLEEFPGHSRLLELLAYCEFEAGNMAEALAVYNRLIQAGALSFPSLLNLASNLKRTGDIEAARQIYAVAGAMHPDDMLPRALRLFVRNYTDTEPGPYQEELRGFTAALGQVAPNCPTTTGARTGAKVGARPDRLRLGYLSADFNRHAVGYFFKEYIALHDSSRFEIVCYDTTGQRDEFTEAIESHSSLWRDVADLPDEALCETIRADRLDCLVDLTGLCNGNRAAALAAGPCPVQAVWLGYFNTTGNPATGHIVCDEVTLPETDEGWYAERPLRIAPGFITCPYDRRALHGPRQGPDNAVVFGCYNDPAKIRDETAALWAMLLRAVPTARLLLRNTEYNSPALRRAHAGRLASLGLDMARVSLEPGLPFEDYLRSLNHIDVHLDTFPYCAGAVAADCLAMGTPLLTLRGKTFAGRMATSMALAAGFKEGICESREDYLARAIAWARDPALVADMKKRLRREVHRSPFMDCQGMMRSLEERIRSIT